MAELKLNSYYGEANLRLDSGAVPALTVENFNPDTATEGKEIIQATISAVQGRKKIRQLQEHFELELTAEGEANGDSY